MRLAIAVLVLAGCSSANPTPQAPPAVARQHSPEDSFVTLCAPAVQAASVISKSRNAVAQALTDDEVAALASVHGDLPRQVRVHFGARLINDWNISGKVHVISDADGMTFGDDIYLAEPYRPGSREQLVTLSHELAHSAQARARGGLWPFADAYCRAFYRSGFDYWSNALEVEARQMAARTQALLWRQP